MSKMKELDGKGCRACGEDFNMDWPAWVVPQTGELVVECPCCQLHQLPEELAETVDLVETCPHCGTAFDSDWEQSQGMDTVYVTCPECHEEMDCFELVQGKGYDYD